MRAVALVLGVMWLVGFTYAGAPRLWFVSDAPVVVAGVGFRPYEKVRVLVSPGPSMRTVRAGARGRFRLTLRASMPRCGGLVVQAIGSRGSRAHLDRTGPDCDPID